MGFSGIGIPSLILIAVIVILLFGTKKLRNMGGDIGGAVKGFRSAMQEGEKEEDRSKDQAKLDAEASESRVIDSEAAKQKKV